MKRSVLVFTLVGGCGWTAPEVRGATPTVAMPGDGFTIDGENFGERPSLTLVLGDQRVPVPVTVASEHQLTGDLPGDLPPGAWALEVTGDHGVADGHPTIDVWTADTEPACAKRYALRVSASRQDAQIRVERLFTDRASVELNLAADALDALLLESTTTTAGKTCSALWAHRKDGTRVLLADDDTRELAQLAEPIADAVNLTLTMPGGAPPAPGAPVPAEPASTELAAPAAPPTPAPATP